MSRLLASASSQYVETDNSSLSGSALTMVAWYKATTHTAICAVGSLPDKDDPYNYHLLYIDTAGRPVAQSRDGSTNFKSSTHTSAITDGVWAHVGMVVGSATSRKAYLNGVAATENTDSVSPAGIDRTSIGRLGRSSPLYYADARIAHFAVWTVALSGAEMALLAAGAPPSSIQPASLVNYVPLTGNTSPEDDLQQAYDFTVSGATYSSDDPTVYAGIPLTGSASVSISGSGDLSPFLTGSSPLALSASGTLSAQSWEFTTPGTHNWTAPPGWTEVRVKTWGAGAGGAGDNNGANGGASYFDAGANVKAIGGWGTGVGGGDQPFTYAANVGTTTYIGGQSGFPSPGTSGGGGGAGAGSAAAGGNGGGAFGGVGGSPDGGGGGNAGTYNINDAASGSTVGGGGGGVSAGIATGVGGGGGGYAEAVVTVVPLTTYTLTVGAGGAGDTVSSFTGGSGARGQVVLTAPVVFLSGSATLQTSGSGEIVVTALLSGASTLTTSTSAALGLPFLLGAATLTTAAYAVLTDLTPFVVGEYVILQAPTPELSGSALLGFSSEPLVWSDGAWETYVPNVFQGFASVVGTNVEFDCMVGVTSRLRVVVDVSQRLTAVR